MNKIRNWLGHHEPVELRSLPVEVRRLVHAVDRVRDKWAESGEERQAELWRQMHEASDAVWGRRLPLPWRFMLRRQTKGSSRRRRAREEQRERLRGLAS